MRTKIINGFTNLRTKVGKRGILGLLMIMAGFMGYLEAEETSRDAVRYGGENAIQNLMNKVDLKRKEESQGIMSIVLGIGLVGFGYKKYRGRQTAVSSE